MLYCVADARYPVDYVSSGMLQNKDGFLHPRRNLDTFVLIAVEKGILYITQNNRDYIIGPNQFIILFEHQWHFGTKPSEGELIYYWTHFHLTDTEYKIYNGGSLDRIIDFSPNIDLISNTTNKDLYVLPSAGNLDPNLRARLLFNQLLDIAKREHFRQTWRCHYALSLLLLEVSYEALQNRTIRHTEISPKIVAVMEYIRTHYGQHLRIDELSAEFNYHPSYLETIFKKSTSYTLTSYINHVRIDNAKGLLIDMNMTLSRVAEQCGFTDEKYFLRTFKKITGMTPTQYRHAFAQKKINLQ